MLLLVRIKTAYLHDLCNTNSKSKTRFRPADGDVGALVPEETSITNSSTHQKVFIWQKKAKVRK